MKRSILTEKLARRGHHIVREYQVDPFVLTRVGEIMTTRVESVPGSLTLHDAARFLLAPERRHPSFPVVDGDGRVLGIIDPPAILAWRRDGQHRKTPLSDLLDPRSLTVAYPDEYLDGLADRLMTIDRAHLPVVSRADGRLLGYVGWKDIMRVRGKLRAEEADRTSFLRLPRRRGA
jgi:CBS domain-containing protein